MLTYAAVDKILKVSDSHAILYLKNGRQLSLTSGVGGIEKLLDWFFAPSEAFYTYNAYKRAEAFEVEDTQKILLDEVG